jgi:hypothetical protein
MLSLGPGLRVADRLILNVFVLALVLCSHDIFIDVCRFSNIIHEFVPLHLACTHPLFCSRTSVFLIVYNAQGLADVVHISYNQRRIACHQKYIHHIHCFSISRYSCSLRDSDFADVCISYEKQLSTPSA